MSAILGRPTVEIGVNDVKIKLTPLGNGDVQAEITNGRHGSALLSGRRETVRKILAEQFPGVEIEDEGG